MEARKASARWRELLAVAALAALPVAAQAPADVRVALVIGNGAYPAPAALPNPPNDAAEMASTLKRLGFSVVAVQDGTKPQIQQAIDAMRDSLKGKQGVAMLFYAGHGVQVDWRNYMVPVDARLASAADVALQTVPLDSALEAFRRAGTRMNIVVLDACRDNPFAGTASGKGLAQLDAPPGTFLAFATAPGNVAGDGDAGSKHSPYTGLLLQELQRPAAKIEDVFKRVRLGVRLQSHGKQVPWEATSLEDDFYFLPAGKAMKAPSEVELEDETNAWEQAKEAGTAAAVAEYLKRYPSGHFSELAQARLDRLEKPAVVPQFRADDTLANNTTTERFRLGDVYEYASSGMLSDGRRQRRFTVTRIGDEVVEMNDGRYVTDRLGNTLSKQDRKWVDAQFMPAEYVVGKKWNVLAQIETQKRNDQVRLQAKVAARERIKVPAGEFDVFRVEISGRGDQGHAYGWTYWMNPRYGMPVKWTVTRSNPRGMRIKDEVHELAKLEAPR